MFSELLRELSLTIKPNHHLLRIQKVQSLIQFSSDKLTTVIDNQQVYLSSCPWSEVQRELLLMNAYKVTNSMCLLQSILGQCVYSHALLQCSVNE